MAYQSKQWEAREARLKTGGGKPFDAQVSPPFPNRYEPPRHEHDFPIEKPIKFLKRHIAPSYIKPRNFNRCIALELAQNELKGALCNAAAVSYALGLYRQLLLKGMRLSS